MRIPRFGRVARGNVKREIGPRAWDASADQVTFTQFVTGYDYNGRNQVTRIALPTSTASSEQHYVHHEYGANGWLASRSLPVTYTVQTQVPAHQKTYVDKYFDTGWIQRARDPGSPPATYEYAAEGWQTERVPWLYCVSCTGGFARDEAHQTDWDYSALGRVTERRQSGADSASQASTYTYDSHGLLIAASLGARCRRR